LPGDDRRPDAACDNTNTSTDSFSEKLPSDIASLRADSHAQADFARALRDGHEQG
jgi:hypothetical protein